MKMSGLDRMLLLLTGLLAAYQIAVGIDGLEFSLSQPTPSLSVSCL